MKSSWKWALPVVAALLLLGCERIEPEPEPTPTPKPEEKTYYSLKPLEEMSLREKVGQLFNVRPEALWHHRKRCQRPSLPQRRVVVRFFQRAQMAEGPGHLITVSFDIPFVARVCSQHIRYLACHAWFLSYADSHSFFSVGCCKCNANFRKSTTIAARIPTIAGIVSGFARQAPAKSNCIKRRQARVIPHPGQCTWKIAVQRQGGRMLTEV